MFRNEGRRVQVPNPDGEGTLLAVYVAPAEPRHPPRFAWVQLLEGPGAGHTVRVPFEAVKPMHADAPLTAQ